jgi:small multidrug resistance pump
MQWLYLSASIIFDVLGTMFFKAHRLPKIQIYLGAVVCYGLSVIPFAWAVRRMDLGLAYALWSALAILGVTIVGIFIFREPITLLKVISLGLIIGGIILLNLSGAWQRVR